MSELFVHNKDIVVPGQVVAKGYDYLPGQGTYRREEDIIANKIGLVSIHGRAIKLISLAGVYVPKRDDVLVCQVIDVTMNGWRINTNTAYAGMISTRDVDFGYISRSSDLTEFLSIGDWVTVMITNVTSQFLIDGTMVGAGLRKLPPGRIIRVNAMKVPRIIGKQGSMVSMIKEHTGCQLYVGQNGMIWFRGQPQAELACERAIRMISDLTHTPGLTERMQAFLEESCAGIDTTPYVPPAGQEETEGGERRDYRERTSGYDRDNRDSRDNRRSGGYQNRNGGGRRYNNDSRRRSFGNR